MKISDTALTIGAVLVGGFLLYLAAKKIGGAAGQLADKVGEAINPVNQNNLANKAVNSVVRAVTGDPSATLGGKIYDMFHPDPLKLKADLTKEISGSNFGGWRYYTDGTAISPDGVYYKNGLELSRPSYEEVKTYGEMSTMGALN